MHGILPLAAVGILTAFTSGGQVRAPQQARPAATARPVVVSLAESSHWLPARGAKDPYAVLFTTRPRTTAAQAASPIPRQPAPANPRVVCGLTIWQVDDRLDPHIKVPVPSGTDFTLRKIVPDVCR